MKARYQDFYIAYRLKRVPGLWFGIMKFRMRTVEEAIEMRREIFIENYNFKMLDDTKQAGRTAVMRYEFKHITDLENYREAA